MREGGIGPADAADAFKSGVPVSGSKLSTREGFLPVGLLEKGGKVANLVGSSMTGKRVERPPLFRGNAESGFTLYLGASVSAVPHLKTDGHRMAERWRSSTTSLKGATCRCSSLTTARRVAGGDGALFAGPRAESEGSGARGAGSIRLNNAVAEGSGARSVGPRHRWSGAESASSRALAERSDARGADSRRRRSGA